MATLELLDAKVVRDDDAVESPLTAQNVCEQPAFRVRRHAVDLVVAWHHCERPCFHSRLEWHEELAAQQTLGHDCRRRVDATLMGPVSREMLQGRETLVLADRQHRALIAPT